MMLLLASVFAMATTSNYLEKARLDMKTKNVTLSLKKAAGFLPASSVCLRFISLRVWVGFL